MTLCEKGQENDRNFIMEILIHRRIKLTKSAIMLPLDFLLCDLKKLTSIWLHHCKVVVKQADTEAIRNNPDGS